MIADSPHDLNLMIADSPHDRNLMIAHSRHDLRHRVHLRVDGRAPGERRVQL